MKSLTASLIFYYWKCTQTDTQTNKWKLETRKVWNILCCRRKYVIDRTILRNFSISNYPLGYTITGYWSLTRPIQYLSYITYVFIVLLLLSNMKFSYYNPSIPIQKHKSLMEKNKLIYNRILYIQSEHFRHDRASSHNEIGKCSLL